jgi:hypothetical protein
MEKGILFPTKLFKCRHIYIFKDKGKFNKLEEISHATKISDKTHQEKPPLQRFYKRTKPNSLEGSKS